MKKSPTLLMANDELKKIINARAANFSEINNIIYPEPNKTNKNKFPNSFVVFFEIKPEHYNHHIITVLVKAMRYWLQNTTHDLVIDPPMTGIPRIYGYVTPK